MPDAWISKRPAGLPTSPCHGRPGTLAEVVLDLVLRPMLPIRNGKLHLFPKPRLPESQAALPLLSESVTGVSTVAGRGEEDF